MNRSVVAAVLLAATALTMTACGDDDVSYVKTPGRGQHTAGQGQSQQTEPTMTHPQAQALKSAKLYLAMGSGFSRAGLIEQLHSQAGEGLPLRDAVWAVDHAHADWNAQAVDAAQTYKRLGGFTKAMLLSQLESQTGDAFTPAQAEYAVRQVFG